MPKWNSRILLGDTCVNVHNSNVYFFVLKSYLLRVIQVPHLFAQNHNEQNGHIYNEGYQ